jgi:hypothetical protein
MPDRDQPLADREERAGIRARSGLLAQRHERADAEDTEDTDAYEGVFDDAGRGEARSEDLVDTCDDPIEHGGGADVRDDEEQCQ